MIVEKSRTSTKHYQHLIEILGKEYIKSQIESPFNFISLAAQGIDANIILNFRKHFDISRSFFAELLNVSEPTIYRWVKSKKKLERNFSIQLFELGDLFLFGTEVFEGRDQFFKWLYLPNHALGGLEPREVLEVPGGVSNAADISGGAALHPGRWNMRGTPVLYTGESKEIALLKTIVHLPVLAAPRLDIITLEILNSY